MRHVLPDTPNFRDFGGHATVDGRRVRTGHFFRSPSLHALSERDADALRRLDPALILDLRGVAERAAAPVQLEGLGDRIASLSVEPGVGPRLNRAQSDGRLTGALAEEIMADAYRGYAGAHYEQFARALQLVCVPRDRPVVFHCSAGKDRTGFLTLLILSGLGVPQEAIRADYLETNARLAHHDGALHGHAPEVRQAVLEVRETYLEAAIAALDTRGAFPDALSQVLPPAQSDTFRSWALQG